MTASMDRFEWVSGFVNAWGKAAEGRADDERLVETGEALYPVLKDQPPEEVARKHFDNTPKPKQRIRQPEKEYTALAVDLGLIKDGDKLDQNLLSFAYGVAEKCASIGDQYGFGRECAGLHIRGIYGEVKRWPTVEEDVPF